MGGVGLCRSLTGPPGRVSHPIPPHPRPRVETVEGTLGPSGTRLLDTRCGAAGQPAPGHPCSGTAPRRTCTREHGLDDIPALRSLKEHQRQMQNN